MKVQAHKNGNVTVRLDRDDADRLVRTLGEITRRPDIPLRITDNSYLANVAMKIRQERMLKEVHS